MVAGPYGVEKPSAEARGSHAAIRRLKMSSESRGSSEVVVLADQNGQYFIIPRDVIEQGRVPHERASDVERLLRGEEVQGFISASYPAGGTILAPLESLSLNFVGVVRPLVESTGQDLSVLTGDLVRRVLG
jgi:hypothetical protein